MKTILVTHNKNGFVVWYNQRCSHIPESGETNLRRLLNNRNYTHQTTVKWIEFGYGVYVDYDVCLEVTRR